MDNASKALIMAGAILIAVAIVGIGIYIYSTTNSIVRDSVTSIETAQGALFNKKFEPYMNRVITGKQVKNFLRVVIDNNIGNSNRFVHVNAYDGIVPGHESYTHKKSKEDLMTIYNAINDRSSYYIKVTTRVYDYWCREWKMGRWLVCMFEN